MQGCKNRSSAKIVDFLALHISSLGLKLLDASKKTYRYLPQPLLCPGVSRTVFYALSLFCERVCVFSHITKLFVRNQNFSYKKLSTQEFILLLPYPFLHYRILFLFICFLKNFLLYSQKSFARKKDEISDGQSDFCSLRS